MAVFFVSCSLGFEEALAEELRECWFEMIDLDGLPTRTNRPELEMLQGGVEFEAPEHLGFQLNFFSKLANRVLLRVQKFEARYYDQFEKALKNFDIAHYTDAKSIKFKIESHKSRLNNEKNLSEAAANAFKTKNITLDDSAEFTVYARIEKDRVTLSLDTSGEHLHKRGYANFRGEAPLRETLAAFLIRKLKKQIALNAGLTIVDPFAGSGTLLFEALSSRLPSLARPYAFQNFKTLPKLFKSDTWSKNYRWLQKQNLAHCEAYDIDQKSVRNLEKNKAGFLKAFQLENVDLKAEQKDSRELNLSGEGKKWIVTNPPYGIRLNDNQAKDIIQKLADEADGLIVIHPEKWKFNFKNLQLVECNSFSNQGLDLKLSVYSRTT